MNLRATVSNGSRSLVYLIPALLVSVLLGACGGGSTGSAEVTIDSIEPASTYPGVDTSVQFSIAPSGDLEADAISWEVDFGDGTTQKGEGVEGEVTHAWENSGQYPLEVAARHDGTTVGTASTSVRVSAPVDMEISNVQPNEANVDAGQMTTASVEVANLSATNVDTPFTLHLFLTDQDSVEADAIPELTEIGRADVQAKADGEPVLGASTTRQVTVEATIPEETSAGDYHLVPWIDPDGELADDNPDNNFAVSDRIIRVSTEGGVLPDVTVEDVVPIPERAYPALNAFSRSYTLRNVGGGDANEVVTKTYLSVGDDELDDDDKLIHEREEPVDIPAEESIEVGPDRFVLNDDITTSGDDKEVWVLVEATLGQGADDVEPSNNVGASDPPITVSDELADGPDISVNDFSISPHQTFLDGSLEVSIDVENQGNADVGTFFCGLYLSSNPQVNPNADRRFASPSITSLDSGESKTIEETVTVSTLFDPGTYHAYVVCDPVGSLEETYRSNNQRVYPETIELTDQADVDMYVDKLEVPKSTKENETTKVTATICVSGSNPSGQTRGELYQSTGNQVDFEAEPFKEFSIPNINPDECADVSIEFEADCQDFEETYAYGVAVDVGDQLPEGDEDNNQKSGSRAMTIQGEYCACNEDMYEPNNKPRDAFGLASGTSSAAVCDPGSCDYFKTLVEADESLRVETTFNADKGSLETTLFDPSGLTSLDSDTSPGRQQVGTFNVSTRGEYIYSVCGVDSDSQNLYDLDVDVLQQVAGIDLIPRRVEVPTQDTFSIGETLSLSFRVNNVGQTDSGSFTTDLVVSPDRDLDDSDNVPLKPATTNVESVDGGSKVDHTVDVTIPPSLMDGEYWIGVEADPNQKLGEAKYDNNTAFSRKIEVKTQCYDPLEPNDSFSKAREIESKSYSNLVACASADDYYKLCAQNGKKFSITASFDDKKGDVDLELYDEQLEIVDSSARTGVDQEKVSVDYVNGDQCYFARAYLLTTQPKLETTYDLEANVEDVDPSLKCSSAFEPNNRFQTASGLIAAVEHADTLDRCPTSDTDYYRVDLSSGQTISVRGIVEPASQPGTLRLQLYSPNEKPRETIETAPGQSTAEIKDFTAPKSGQYYLQVTMTGSQRKSTYRLEADGLGGIDLAARNLDFWPGSYKAGDPLLADFELANQRSDTAKSPTYEVFVGDGKTLDAQNDTRLGSFTHSDMTGNSSATVTPRTTLPDPLPSWAGSTQAYIHVRAQTGGNQTDSNPANNVASQPITLSP